MALHADRSCLPSEPRARLCTLICTPFLPALIGMLLGASAQAAEVALPEPQFNVARYVIDGNTVLPDPVIAQNLAPFTGNARRFADVEAARQALIGAYIAAGFSTVQVELPEQDITEGVIHLKVNELKIGAIKLLGAKHHDQSNAQNSLPGLVEGEVPNTVEVAESLRLANENPTKQTHLLFKPDPEQGKVDVLLRLDDEKPWKAFASLDNTGTDETGRARLGVGYQHANLFNRDQVLTLQYITSPDHLSDVSIYGLGYRIPLYAQASAIDLYAGYSDVTSGNVQGLFNVSGKGSIFGARYTHNLRKTSAFEHRLYAGLDFRAYENEVEQGGTAINTDVTVRPVSAGYSVQWLGKSNQANASITGIANIAGGNNGDDAAFAASRVGADAHYQLLRLNASYSQQLPKDWQLRMGLETQYSHEPLVSGEQFGIGGQDSVRGFAERSISGDRGYRYGIEVFTPDMGDKIGVEGARLRLSAFLEGGHTERLNPQPGETASEQIASTGLAMRFGLDKSLSARLDYGFVLKGGGDKDARDGHLHASMAYTF